MTFTITMGTGDIVLTALIALLLVTGPPFWWKWFTPLFAWGRRKWTERSERSAQKRLDALKRRLIRLKSVEPDTRLRTLQAIKASATSTNGAVITIGAIVGTVLLANLGILGGLWASCVTIIGAGLFTWAEATARLHNLTDTEKEIADTGREIDRLEKRLGQFPREPS